MAAAGVRPQAAGVVLRVGPPLEEHVSGAVEGEDREGGGRLGLVRDGALRTPFLDGTNLTGITRDSVIRIAEDLGIEVQEGSVARESLYTADELFFTGTASEVTPIRSVDRISVGEGKAGPVTLTIQKRFMEIVRGNAPDDHGWLDMVR